MFCVGIPIAPRINIVSFLVAGPNKVFFFLSLSSLLLKKLKLNSDVIQSNLDSKPWITQERKRYGPSDVIKNPGKYPDDEERIKKANLDYPVYIDYNGDVLDGYHRLTKAAIQKKPTIDVKVFTKDLLDKFLIAKDYKDVRKWKLHNYIEKFEKEFCD